MAILSAASPGYSQAGYLGMFGVSGCTTNNVRLSASATPSSGTVYSETDINDKFAYTHSGVPSDNLQTSTYNTSGQLMFSVNSNGIYDR